MDELDDNDNNAGKYDELKNVATMDMLVYELDDNNAEK